MADLISAAAVATKKTACFAYNERRNMYKTHTHKHKNSFILLHMGFANAFVVVVIVVVIVIVVAVAFGSGLFLLSKYPRLSWSSKAFCAPL